MEGSGGGGERERERGRERVASATVVPFEVGISSLWFGMLIES